MSQTGDGDDDPQLRALRAVWLAMPDEDPPSRGLDALMAAARAKADEMTALPWWRRMLDLLRKPPVLALASVMVLIGGAVLISQRTDVAEAPLRERAPQKTEPPVVQPVAPAGAAKESAPALPGSPAPEPAPTADHPHSGADVTPVKPAPEPPRVAPPHHTPRSDVTAPAFTPTTKKSPVTKQKVDAHAGRGGDGDIGGLKSGEAAPEIEDTTTARGPRQVMVDELLVQSKSAADRGDCENARLIAKRIEKQDLAFYRTRVANDAAIQKCITSATTKLSE